MDNEAHSLGVTEAQAATVESPYSLRGLGPRLKEGLEKRRGLEEGRTKLQDQVGWRESFPTWAFSTVGRLRKAAGFGAILAAAWSIRNLEPNKWLGQGPSELKNLLEIHSHDRAALAFIQAAACLVLALLTPKPSTAPLMRRARPDERDFVACRRIQLFIIAIYLAWSLYYLITGLTLENPHGLFDTVVSMTLNTSQGLLLFWLYLELAEVTVDPPIFEIGSSRTATFTGAAFHHTFSVGLFALVVAPAWYAYGTHSESTIQVFEVISSCLNGVALALVVGRLGSKNIDPGPLTLGLLYFYAVIQPMAASFSTNPAVHLMATTVALPLKVLLWLVCVWAFTTGILAEYVHSVRALLQNEDRATQG